MLQWFCDINLQVLNQHAPLKISMKRSRPSNNFLRNRTEENKIIYNKQRNYCVSLLRQSKRGYYENLNIKKIT